MLLLVVTGFFQSIFWTAQNAFVFADVEDRDSGQANVISQVGVQLTLAFGVAVGGGALEGIRLLHGGVEPLLSDFHFAFYVMAGFTLISTLLFFRLPRHAAISGTPASDGASVH
jgi:hypothetical protein